MGMVFCRGCGKEIHETAPSCPHCGALQGLAPQIEKTENIPEGIKGWSWGAFIFGPIWAVANKTWIGALAFVPYVGFIMSIILGFKGREWAWKNKQWESVEHFNKVQKKWSVWAVGLIILIIVIGIIVGVSGKASELIDKARQKADFGSAEVKLVKDGHLQSCPSHTVDQMVEGFMESPSWKSGKSEDGKTYVNIEGGITFHDKPVRAMIQFIVEGDNFSFNAFEMNGVPSANIIAIGLLDKMCANAVVEASPASSAKIEPEAPDLSSLIGQAPGVALEHATLKAKFQGLLGEKLKDFSDRLDVSSGIELQGEWLVGQGGMPHLFSIEEAAFAVNVKTTDAFAIMLREGKDISWFGAAEVSELPVPLQNWFQEHKK